MALDPELLLLRDDGEEEFGKCSRREAREHGRQLLDLGCSALLLGQAPVWLCGPCSKLISGFL